MLVIGIGNEFRGDDALGIKAVKSLQSSHPNLAKYRFEQGDLSRLLDVWKDQEVVLVDAIASKELKPGAIYLAFSYSELIKDRESLFSTHGISLLETLELAMELNKMPTSIFFVGVEGSNWKMSNRLTEKVEKSISKVRERIIRYLKLSEEIDNPNFAIR
jgi:hydrogenase maturation protease